MYRKIKISNSLHFSFTDASESKRLIEINCNFSTMALDDEHHLKMAVLMYHYVSIKFFHRLKKIFTKVNDVRGEANAKRKERKTIQPIKHEIR